MDSCEGQAKEREGSGRFLGSQDRKKNGGTASGRKGQMIKLWEGGGGVVIRAQDGRKKLWEP